jgi:hypothetical protein
MPFYAAITCEVVAATRVVNEPLLATLLPYLAAGLAIDAMADYRAATYMVVAQLAARAAISEELVTGGS